MVRCIIKTIFHVTNWLTIVNRPTNQEALFRTVVVLNRLRILSRIRSRHAAFWRARGKAPLLRRLRTAKELLQKSSIGSTRAQSLAGDVDNLQSQFDRLEDMCPLEARSSRSGEHLMRLVKSIHSIFLWYEQDLKLIPYTPGLWSGNATESLIDRLGKISQYVKACEELLKAARRYRIFSNIVVKFVDLQQVGRHLSKDAASDEIIEAGCTRETLSRISSQHRKSVLSIRESIKARLSEISRLHAKIQLVLYYEQEATFLRPRVICSSKSACYLCHLLLRIHGQFYVPSTYGKLYGTWKWPVPSHLPNVTERRGAKLGLQHLLSEFSNAIDRKIRDCFNNIRVMRRMEPLESRVDLLATMTPSIQSYISQDSRTVCSGVMYQEVHVDVAATETDDTDDVSSSTRRESCEELAPLSQTTPSQLNTPLTKQILRAEDSVSCSGVVTPTMIRHPSRSGSMLSLRGGSILSMVSHEGSLEFGELQREPLFLRKGEISNFSFNMENKLLQIHIPDLHVVLQYDASPAQTTQLEGRTPQAQNKSFQMEIQCLYSSMHCNNNSLAQVVDLEDGD